LKELPLPKCVEIWGFHPFGYNASLSPELEAKKNASSTLTASIGGRSVPLPIVAPKYLKWLRNRSKISREVCNMIKLRGHPSVVELKEVLELVQDSKSTLFLVMELVTGGELFERMRSNHKEGFARKYFNQLLAGIEYCHMQGNIPVVLFLYLTTLNLVLSRFQVYATETSNPKIYCKRSIVCVQVE
jgi:serine/threonine protein kinase